MHKRIFSVLVALCVVCIAVPVSAATSVAITVDDCWSAANVRMIMNLAGQYGFKLTFFPCGQAVSSNPSVWREAVRRGHEIGNHSWDHTSFAKLSTDGIYSQLSRMQNAVNKALGYKYRMRYVRAPYGSAAKVAKTLTAVRKMGYRDSVLWSTTSLKKDSILAAAKVGKRNMLFHAYSKDVAALKIIIPALYKAGYKSVTLSQYYG